MIWNYVQLHLNQNTQTNKHPQNRMSQNSTDASTQGDAPIDSTPNEQLPASRDTNTMHQRTLHSGYQCTERHPPGTPELPDGNAHEHQQRMGQPPSVLQPSEPLPNYLQKYQYPQPTIIKNGCYHNQVAIHASKYVPGSGNKYLMDTHHAKCPSKPMPNCLRSTQACGCLQHRKNTGWFQPGGTYIIALAHGSAASLDGE